MADVFMSQVEYW